MWGGVNSIAHCYTCNKSKKGQDAEKRTAIQRVQYYTDLWKQLDLEGEKSTWVTA